MNNLEEICKKLMNNAIKKENQKLDKDKIIESYNKYYEACKLSIGDVDIKKGYRIACVIAFKDRHNMVELNIQTLLNQTLIPAIILVASNPEDAVFCKKMKDKYPNIFIRIYPNYPIGGKWNAGVQFAKIMDINALLILGSDDLLSLGYIEEAYEKIGRGVGSKCGKSDLVGSIKWMIYDIDNKLYKLSYNPQIVPITLGGGRMYSRYFLDSCDWNIFRKYRAKHLDEEGHNAVKKFSNKIELISGDEFILSIKGPWEVMNTTKKILNAGDKITWKEITDEKEKIFSNLKVDNMHDFLG